MTSVFKRTLRVAFATVLMTAATASQAVDRGDAARGEQLAQVCMACHSAEAVAANPTFPRIQGQHAEYLLAALRHYANGRRQNALMQAQVASLSLQDKRDLATWFAQQPGELYTPSRP